MMRVYNRCPRVAQTVGINMMDVRNWSTDHSSSVKEGMNLMRKAQSWNEDELFEYQSSMLRRMVKYAYHEVPFYHRLYKEHGIDISSIRTVNDLPRLPMITKAGVLEHWREIVPQRWTRYRRVFTSGTTGMPLEIRLSNGCYSISRAAQLTRNGWAGHRDELIARFVGDRPVSGCNDQHLERRSYVSNRLIFPSYCISVNNFPKIMEALSKHDVNFIQCYPSTVFILAKLLERRDEHYPLKALLYGSEPMHGFQRALIEERFQTKAYGFYGQAEAVVFAMECEQGNYHLAGIDGVLEAISNNGTVSSGERGHTVGTTLCNFAMPLIRYRLEDYSGYRGEYCGCGRRSPTIFPVETRSNDLVITPGGRILPPGVFGQPMLAAQHVTEAQIVQKAIDQIVIRVVPSDGYSDADESRILDAFRRCLGDGISVGVEKVDRIHHPGSLKRRWIVSELGGDIFDRAMAETRAR